MALEKAVIINLDTGEQIPVMFNPEEYSLELGNTFAEIGVPGLAKPPVQYIRGTARQLQMELFFDTYEQRRDVRRETQRVVTLLEKVGPLQAPPILLFSWGTLQFKCVLERVSQRFIMFLQDGSPVRARLNITLKEYERITVDIEHGLFVGPPSVRNVIEGDTLDRFAYEYLGDPGAWRAIAELNNIDDPFALIPGTTLVMPSNTANQRG